MIYKNIPHISLEEIEEKFFGLNYYMGVIIEEKIDGAPLVVGKDENGLYVQTGRSSKIYNSNDSTNVFETFTLRKTNNEKRIKRAQGYDSLRNVLVAYSDFFDDLLSVGEWVRYEVLSILLTENEPFMVPHSPFGGFEFLKYTNKSVLEYFGGEINKRMGRLEYRYVTNYVTNYVTIYYSSRRFPSSFNLIEVDSNVAKKYSYPKTDEVKPLYFEKNYKIALMSNDLDDRRKMSGFANWFSSHVDFLECEGLILKFFGENGIETYKLTTKLYKAKKNQQMKKFKDFMNQNKTAQDVVFAFGRFQPPTIGHQLLIQKVLNESVVKNADGFVFTSFTEDNKKNPLSPDKKFFWLKKIFKINIPILFEKNPLDAMVALNKKYNHSVTVVCGSDRVEEYKNLFNKYNGDLYHFDEIFVISCGVREADSDESNSSGTLVRNAANNNDFETVRKNVPIISDDDVWILMDDLTTKKKNLNRESYITGQYLKVNDIVFDDDGRYKILKTGTNYLTLVNESSEIVVKWITEVKKSKSMGKCFKTIMEKEIKYNGYQTQNIHKFSGLSESLKLVIEKYDAENPLEVLNVVKMTDKFCETLIKIPSKLNESELKTMLLLDKYAGHVGFDYFDEIINEVKTTHDLAKSKLTGTEFIKKLNDIKNDEEEEESKDNNNDGDVGIGDTLIDADDVVTKQHIKLKFVDEEFSDDEFSDFDVDKFVDEIPEDDILDLFEPSDFVFVDDNGDIVDELDDGEKDKIDEVLSRQGRIQAKARFRRSQSKRLRNAKIALKRRSSSDKLEKKARRLAVDVLKRKLAKKDLNKLSISEKERLERMVARKGKVITRMVGRLVTKIKKIESNRLARK